MKETFLLAIILVGCYFIWRAFPVIPPDPPDPTLTMCVGGATLSPSDSCMLLLRPEDAGGMPGECLQTDRVTQTGYCVVNGSGPNCYAANFSSASTVTITGATHKLGTADLNVMVWDNSSPRKQIIPASVTVDTSSFDVVITFIALQSGRVVNVRWIPCNANFDKHLIILSPPQGTVIEQRQLQ